MLLSLAEWAALTPQTRAGPNGGQKSELVDFRFAGKRVGHDNNLVEGTRWSVHPHGGASRLPRALRAVKFLEFTHRVEL